MRKFGILLSLGLMITFSAQSQGLMNTGSTSEEKKESNLGNSDMDATLRTSDEFGKELLRAIQSANPAELNGLLYKRDDLLATVEKQTTDMNFKMKIQKELPEEFDEMVRSENRNRFYSLLNSQAINWSRASFTEFEFKQNESRSKEMNIITGSGYLRFSYEGRNYQVLVDKVSQLVTGWRGHEIGTRAELVYKNQ